MLPTLLDLAYLGCGPVIAYKAITMPRYRKGWKEKLLGRVPLRRGNQPCLWLHGVSVGEVLSLRPLLRGFREQFPAWQPVLSTTTTTGMEMVRQHFPDLLSFFFPLDFTWAVHAALNRIRPEGIALVESELWPQFVRAAHGRGVRLAVLNGRMSPRSFRGYQRIRPLVTPTLRRLDVVAAQNDEYAERFAALGADPARIVVTGSIKYDGLETDRTNPRTQELARRFAICGDETVFVAGSTQAPEEAFSLDAYEHLKHKFRSLRLILVPRHKERFDEVADLLKRRSVPFVRRSELNSSDPVRETGDALRLRDGRAPVILVDTIGELAAVWGLAHVAFVGGSLSGRGGQNMIEPAAYAAAVLFGPDTWNFRETVHQLLSRQAARVVQGRDDLIAAVESYLLSPDTAVAQGQRAQAFVLSQHGATQRTLDALSGLLKLADPRLLR